MLVQMVSGLLPKNSFFILSCVMEGFFFALVDDVGLMGVMGVLSPCLGENLVKV